VCRTDQNASGAKNGLPDCTTIRPEGASSRAIML
jgi:hypothetical protein